MFPEIQGDNLESQHFKIPFDLKEEFNLVIIAFKRYQQFTINQWVPPIEELQMKYPIFEYYELPILANRNRAFRSRIDGGMRAGIRDKTTRERTITVYMNKNRLKAPLEIKNEEDIHVILMTRQGKILWRDKGEVTQAKIDGIKKKLHEIKVS